MKKALFLFCMFSIASSSSIAANPFVDVPKNHWGYESIQKLSEAKIIEGYDDHTFRGDRLMTRYEMAKIIAYALANSEQANAMQKAEIDKLSVEFAKELNSLGVRVTALESDKGKVSFKGDYRLRYKHSEDGYWANQNFQESRLRLEAEGKIDSHLSAIIRMKATDNLRAPKKNDGKVEFDKLQLQAKYGSSTIRVGQFYFMPAYGIMYDYYMSGVEATWSGKHYRLIARTGHLSTTSYTAFDPSHRAYVGEIRLLNIVPKLNMRGQYTYIDGKTNQGGVWEAGADYTFGNSGVKLTAGAADSTGDLGKNGMGDIAWFTQINYKGAKRKEIHSWGLLAGYRDFQDSDAATGQTTFFTNGKGWYVGATYTPVKDMVLEVRYDKMKPFQSNGTVSNTYRDFFLAEARFYF